MVQLDTGVDHINVDTFTVSVVGVLIEVVERKLSLYKARRKTGTVT